MKQFISIISLIVLSYCATTQPIKVSFLPRQFITSIPVNPVFNNPNAVSFGNVDSIHAGGNSITFGLNGPPGDGVTWQSYDSSWINRLIDSTGIPVENDGSTGTGLWYALQEFIKDSMHGTDRSAAIIAAGYNDVRYLGADSFLMRKFRETIRMHGLLQFMDRTTFKAAGDCDVSNPTQWNRTFFQYPFLHTVYLEPTKFNALNIGGTDTSTWIKYDFTGDNVAFAFRISDEIDNPAGWFNDEWDIYVDGVKQNTSIFSMHNYGSGNIARWGWEVSPPANCFILRGFGGGNHTIKIHKRVDNSGSGSTFDFFCTLQTDTSLVRPIVLMEIQKQTAAGYAAGSPFNSSTDVDVDAANNVIRQMVGYWHGMGYRGKIINALLNDYYTPATDEDTDLVHPKNTTGHRAWWRALRSVISF